MNRKSLAALLVMMTVTNLAGSATLAEGTLRFTGSITTLSCSVITRTEGGVVPIGTDIPLRDLSRGAVVIQIDQGQRGCGVLQHTADIIALPTVARKLVVVVTLL